MFVSKNLIRYEEKENLKDVNKREMNVLTGQFESGEFLTSVLEFISSRKSKL